jgi:hypothetical protein
MPTLLPDMISRRAALKLLSVLGLAGLLPSTATAAELPALSTLDSRQAELLQATAKTLFPHDFLDDKYYLAVVTAIDSRAAADDSFANVLIAALTKYPDGFAEMSEADREAYLGSIEDSAYFELVYDATLQNLYGSPEVARLFGYEGSSIEFGGYINRGFDNADWLPVD